MVPGVRWSVKRVRVYNDVDRKEGAYKALIGEEEGESGQDALSRE